MKKLLFFSTCIFCALQNTKAQEQNRDKVTIEYDCIRNKTTVMVLNGAMWPVDSVHIYFEDGVLKSKNRIDAFNHIMITDPKCNGEMRRLVWFMDGEKHSRDLIIKPLK